MIANLNTIRSKGYRALRMELGIAGAVVFLRQLENGTGNYAEDRHDMMSNNSVDNIAERIKKRNSQQDKK